MRFKGTLYGVIVMRVQKNAYRVPLIFFPNSKFTLFSASDGLSNLVNGPLMMILKAF